MLNGGPQRLALSYQQRENGNNELPQPVTVEFTATLLRCAMTATTMFTITI